MGQKEKLLARLKDKPKDFTFAEAESLLEYYGYKLNNKGKTSGSRIMFVGNKGVKITLHKPHNRKELLDYQVNQLLEFLNQEDLL